MSVQTVKLLRTNGESTDNAAQTVSTPSGDVRRIHHIFVRYSATPTHSGVTVTLNSGAGAAYDYELHASAANAETVNYVPDGDLVIDDDDVIDVTAPAGGAGITSNISIYTSKVL